MPKHGFEVADLARLVGRHREGLVDFHVTNDRRHSINDAFKADRRLDLAVLVQPLDRRIDRSVFVVDRELDSALPRIERRQAHLPKHG